MQVLLVEDDTDMANILFRGFKEEGIILDCVVNSEYADEYLAMKEYDVIILDRLLPGLDGVSYCELLRKRNISTPILILSSQSDVDSRVEGLNSGADDYLAKPFHFRELIARVRALSKRTMNVKNHILSVEELTLNLMSREVKRFGVKIDLRNNEFNLLALLLKHKNRVVTKTEIIDYIWSIHDFFDPNILNVTIYNLRKKIEIKKDKRLIYTVRGIGYKISE